MSNANRRVFKIHLFDLLATMLFLGRKVTAEDITHHLYSEQWADADKYDILGAVNDALDREMKKQEGKQREDHYGLRKSDSGILYWIDYHV